MQKEELNLPLRIATARKLVASLSCLNTAILVGFCSLSPAVAGNSETLPPGDYVYLGERNTGSAPKTFSIDTKGSILWNNQDGKRAPLESESAATNQPSADQTSSKSHKRLGLPLFNGKKSQLSGQNQDPNATRTQQLRGSKKWQPISGQFESYNFPTIEWKPKPVAGTTEGIAQLSTTMEAGTSRFVSGFVNVLKLRLRLLKCPISPVGGWTVTLLDKNGFRILDVCLYQFHQVAGTDMFEGQASKESVSEIDYRRAVDYTVNP